MKKIWNWLTVSRFLSIVLSIALFLFIIFYPNDNKTRILRIKEQDSIIDTIYKNNDSIIRTIKWKEAKLNTIQKEYEETNNIIYNQSTDSDLLFFTNYLERFRANQQGTTENN